MKSQLIGKTMRIIRCFRLLNKPLTEAFEKHLMFKLIIEFSSAYKPTCRLIPDFVIPTLSFVPATSLPSLSKLNAINLIPLNSAFPEIRVISCNLESV